MFSKNYWAKRICIDTLFLLFSIVPCVVAFFTDINGATNSLFMRSGAIMVLFAAFLEFRTYQIQVFRERDHIINVWKTFGILTEGLANVDKATKYILREMSNLIASAGMKPAMGSADEIKDMVVSEKIKALKHLPNVPEYFYKYTRIISIIGKILVIIGTLVWAFGDYLIKI